MHALRRDSAVLRSSPLRRSSSVACRPLELVGAVQATNTCSALGDAAVMPDGTASAAQKPAAATPEPLAKAGLCATASDAAAAANPVGGDATAGVAKDEFWHSVRSKFAAQEHEGAPGASAPCVKGESPFGTASTVLAASLDSVPAAAVAAAAASDGVTQPTPATAATVAKVAIVGVVPSRSKVVTSKSHEMEELEPKAVGSALQKAAEPGARRWLSAALAYGEATNARDVPPARGEDGKPVSSTCVIC